jgi:hypothetical protein
MGEIKHGDRDEMRCAFLSIPLKHPACLTFSHLRVKLQDTAAVVPLSRRSGRGCVAAAELRQPERGGTLMSMRLIY